MSDTVEFDPGIGQFAEDSNSYINGVYSQLMSFHSISQKRARFRLFSNKIYSVLENNIAFYEGCLLWAYYIKKSNNSSPKTITGNVFLNLSSEQLEEYDYLIQVNFLENYFECYERDTQYYTGKTTKIPQKWVDILGLYKEFLELNKGFTNTKTTADLLLPQKLSDKNFVQDIYEIIKSAIENKNLVKLLEVEI